MRPTEERTTAHSTALSRSTLKRDGPIQRTQRKERKEPNEMTSSLDRPITAAGDDSVCRWHAAKLWQTRHKI